MTVKRSSKFKIFLVFALILVQLLSVSSFSLASDLKGHWAEEPINSFLEKGLASGYSDGNFKPDSKITRAEFVVLVNKTFGLKETKKVNFSDVSSTDWFYNDIAIASSAGYILGYQDNTFQPNSQITRQEAAVIICKVLKLDSSDNASLGKLKDAEQLPAWSRQAVGIVLAKNYMKGYPDQTFKPQNKITRAEAVVTLNNAKFVNTPAVPAVPPTPGSTSGGGHSGGGGGNDNGITTKQDLLDAVASGGSKITIDGDIDLGETTLDINRAVTINGENHTLTGNVSVNAENTVLNNLTITGDLVLGEGIQDGDATLNGVTVNGETVINGGGQNSIHFNDSVLATVIVNKNTGAVRVVVEGSTTVSEIQLETPTIVNAVGLSGSDAGIENVIISESLQPSDGDQPEVQLLGSFETVNSRATNIRINLSSETDIRTLVLNAVTTVLGSGNIVLAEINVDGSTLSQRPQNVVLDNGATATIDGETVDQSYSEATSAAIAGISATQASISVQLDTFVAGVTENDFDVTATLDGEPYSLQGLSFNSARNRFTFEPVSLTDNIGKHLVITVAPTIDGKITGSAKSADVVIGTGFEGRITDISEIGMSGLTIKFRQGSGTVEGAVYAEAVTDRYGYYSVALPAGTYTGEITGKNIIPTYLIAAAPSDIYLTEQNETAFRAAGSNEIKIVLTWGEQPRDEDSHLIGPTQDGGTFHTWYSDKQYSVNGTVYADLDWDDTQSYGPETTTIRKLVDGKYTFYVHNFSEEAPLRNSGATVKVYKGNALTPSYSFNVPTGEGNEMYWIVFDMDVSQQGREINITEVKEMTDAYGPVSLLEVISEAQFLAGMAVVGEEVGNFPQQAVDALNNAIIAAQAVAEDENATREQVYAAEEALVQAIENFFNSIIRPAAPVIALDQNDAHQIVVSNGQEGALIKLYYVADNGDVVPEVDMFDEQLTATVVNGYASFGDRGPGKYVVTQTVEELESNYSNIVEVPSDVPVANNAPVAKNSLDQTATVGDSAITMTPDQLATDADGNTLSIVADSAASDAAGVATAAVVNGNLEITVVGAGDANITVDVTDGTDTVTVTVPVHVAAAPAANNAPVANGSLDQTATVGDSAITMTPDLLATDADGDILSLVADSAASDAAGVATAAVVNGNLEITVVGAGDANITVNVSDGTDTVTVTVPVHAAAVPVANNAPVANGSLDQTATVGNLAITMTPDQLATDADGDPLSIVADSAASDAAGVATAAVVNGNLEITIVGAGDANITANLSDGTDTVTVTVPVHVA